jgi:predicted ferric reductase
MTYTDTEKATDVVFTFDIVPREDRHMIARRLESSRAEFLNEASEVELEGVSTFRTLEKSEDRGQPTPSIDNDRCSNESHPALEYPPLYFVLQKCPWLIDRIRSAYALRWRVSYPLQRKVIFSRCLLRRFGITLTWGELLLLVPFYAAVVTGILYTAVFPSVSATGATARLALIASLVFAQRNSLVTLLIGVPFDRGLFYHKLAGRVAGITGVLHTVSFFVDPAFRSAHSGDALSGAFTGQINISGSMLMLLIVGITVSSLPQVRRRVFEVFYYLHVIFAAGMIICAFFHSGKLVPILAALTWGGDLFIRSIVMARTRYPRKAQLKVISESVVEVSFPKTTAFAYNPGQYVFLAIPEISWLQWHPFSISSSPSQALVTLHIRMAGNWTSALFELAKSTKKVSMLVEGPYGNLSVDIMGDRKYKSIMLISGGIGSE